MNKLLCFCAQPLKLTKMQKKKNKIIHIVDFHIVINKNIEYNNLKNLFVYFTVEDTKLLNEENKYQKRIK